jgi:hypothetical protein
MGRTEPGWNQALGWVAGQLRLPVAEHLLQPQLDGPQYEKATVLCLDVALVSRTIWVTDLAGETRWPRTPAVPSTWACTALALS